MKDIILNENGDILIKNGDFVIDESDYQHIEHILIAAPGHYKMTPLLGCNLPARMKGNIDGQYRAKVSLQLAMDGYKLKRLNMIDGTLSIDAQRNEI